MRDECESNDDRVMKNQLEIVYTTTEGKVKDMKKLFVLFSENENYGSFIG